MGRARGRTCRRWTTSHLERVSSAQVATKVGQEIAPNTHVLRLVLHPGHGRARSVRGKGLLELVLTQRIELFDAQDGYVVSLALAALPLELIIDFAGAEQHLLGIGLVLTLIQNDALKRAIFEVSEVADRLRMAEQALGRKHDQRLTPRTQHLAPEQMEKLRRGGRLTHLHVVFRCLHEESLHARAGVLWALPFKAMRQQHDDTAQSLPLVLSAGDELIDDDLRDVDEVTKLGFPQDEPIRPIQAVAVLKTEHTRLTERAVLYLDGRLIGGKMRQWDQAPTRLGVVQGRVAMTERATTAILPGQA